MKKNIPKTVCLQTKYKIQDKSENVTSKPALGRITYVHQNGFWIEMPDVKADGMHISFGNSAYTRNLIEFEIQTIHPVDQINLTGEVEWYELIPSGKDFRFNVGIIIKEISGKDRIKYNSLVELYKEDAK